MKHPTFTSRREFLTRTGLTAGLAAGAITTGATGRVQAAPAFALGVASYTFRKFDADQAIAMTKRMGVTKICLKDFHLPMDASPALIRDTAAKARAAGLDLYGCGVVYMRSEADVHRAGVDLALLYEAIMTSARTNRPVPIRPSWPG